MDVHIDLEEKQLQTIEGSHVTALGKYCPYVEESLVSYWDNDMEAMQCIKWSRYCLSFHLVIGRRTKSHDMENVTALVYFDGNASVGRHRITLVAEIGDGD
jgi:hypothetical protein